MAVKPGQQGSKTNTESYLRMIFIERTAKYAGAGYQRAMIIWTNYERIRIDQYCRLTEGIVFPSLQSAKRYSPIGARKKGRSLIRFRQRITETRRDNKWPNFLMV
jgi:hypothetical protein